MTKIVILCGESPLPVCQALKTLAADEVVIIHGQGGSKNVADRVKDFCKDKDTLKIDESKVHLLEVDAFHPIRCQETLFANKTLLASSALVYGPGTSVMNAMIHDVWRWAGGNEFKVGQSWYLQATPSRLLPSNAEVGKDSKVAQPTGLDCEGLIKLHIPDGLQIRPLTNPNIETPDIVANQVFNALYLGTVTNKQLAKAVHAHEDFTQQFHGQFDLGHFLEIVVYQVFQQSFDLDEIAHSIEVVDYNNEAILEMDVLLKKGDKSLWISCATLKAVSTSPLRKKYFEAMANATRLGGKEARSLTIVSEFNAKHNFAKRIQRGIYLRKRLDLPAECTAAHRHVIINIAELLGADPNATVKAAQNDLQRNAAPWLRDWILSALND
jgi:hypothetical protein